MSKIIFEKDFARHPLHYFTLLSVELIGLWGILWFSFQPVIQFALLICMALSYLIWGIIHHHEHQDLHPRIVFEYLTIAVLGILIIGSILFQV